MSKYYIFLNVKTEKDCVLELHKGVCRSLVGVCAWLKREQSRLSLKASLVWFPCDLERKILFVDCQVYGGARKQGNTHCEPAVSGN